MKIRIFAIMSTLSASMGIGLVQSSAGAMPTGPFAGTMSEGWESFPTPAYYISYLSNPTGIMGGNALISHPQLYI